MTVPKFGNMTVAGFFGVVTDLNFGNMTIAVFFRICDCSLFRKYGTMGNTVQVATNLYRLFDPYLLFSP